MQRVLRRSRTRAFLVTDPVNIRYLTDLEVSQGALLIFLGRYELFVDQRYREAAEEVQKRGLNIFDVSELPARMPRGTVGCEADHLTVSRLLRLQKKFPRTRFRPKASIIESLRRTKSHGEVQKIVRACRITKRVLSRVPTLLTTGMTERALARQLEECAVRLGAHGMAFQTIVAFGANTSRPHHHPTDRRLERTDIVQVDMGALYQGYCSDFSRVYFRGSPTGDMRRALRAVNAARRAAEALVRPGVSVRALDAAARNALKTFKMNKYFVHSLGHGLGLAIHEAPSISGKSKDGNLQRGDVITIEPGVYFPGSFGIRIENTIVVR